MRLRRRTVVAGLGLVAVSLAVVNIVANALLLIIEDPPPVAWTLLQQVDLGSERNLPTYFSTMLIVSAAILTAIVGRTVRLQGGHDSGRWYALAIVLGYLSYDEFASIHETVGEPFDQLFIESRILWYGWIIPGTVFVVIVGMAFIGFLRRLDPLTRTRFLIAAAVFVGGALGVEAVEAWVAFDKGYNSPLTIGTITVEESMEMAGMILFIGAVLDHLQRASPSIVVGLHDG